MQAIPPNPIIPSFRHEVAICPNFFIVFCPRLVSVLPVFIPFAYLLIPLLIRQSVLPLPDARVEISLPADHLLNILQCKLSRNLSERGKTTGCRNVVFVPRGFRSLFRIILSIYHIILIGTVIIWLIKIFSCSNWRC